MARTIYQYKPINDTPDVAIGILLPFNKSAARRVETNDISGYSNNASSGGSVFVSSYTTEEQSISNFKNLLLTSKGERLMQPNFGTRIKESLFEQNTESLSDFLSTSLRDDIELWLPYIIIDSIDVIRNEYTIEISIHFRVTETGANLVINILASENAVVVSNVAPSTNVQLVAVGTLQRRV
jgi:phage baseplate assembly protein W